MQPQQPEAPSDAQAPADTSSQPAASERSEAPSQNTSWLQRLWRGRRAGEEEQDSNQEPAATGQASQITLSQDELDRRVQAETDRREQKRLQQANAERRRKLRDEDPWAYAEEERNAEQHAMSDQQVSGMFGQIGATHDRYTLDPLVQSLPEAERNRILAMQGAGAGLDGRKLIVTEGLKALEKHWKEEGARDAEAKLRRNQAFRKQVLSEFRRGVSEPEFFGGGAPSAGDRSVSDLLRGNMRQHRSA